MFLFELPQPKLSLFTHAITIQNLGRKTAKNVQIVHKRKPDFFKLQPALDYKESFTPAGEHVVTVDTLGPKDFFAIEFLSYATVAELLLIRSEEGPAVPIQIQPQRIFPKWFNALAIGLLLVGAGFVAYWIVRAVIFISKNIGIGGP